MSGALPVQAQQGRGSEARAGQRGWGLTVLRGTEPERFEVEVLGQLDAMDPGVRPLLVRLSGAGLEETGVIAGMSGSPVFVEGQLVGAVAFAWPFSKGSLAGVMPIESMRAVPSAVPVASLPAARSRESWQELVQRLGRENAESRWVRWLERIPGGRPGAPPGAWQLAGLGFGTRSAEWLARVTSSRFVSLPAMDRAGGPAASVPAALGPGSAVAQIWIDGDLRLAATGTVTERDGDRVLAFGHAVLGLGPVEIPMAPAEVVAVVPSALASFKLVQVGAPVGRFEVDHLAGGFGVVGKPASTTPLELSIQGLGQDRSFRLQLARIPLLFPILGALGLFGALDVATPAAGVGSVDLDLALDLGPFGSVSLAQSFDGEDAALGTALFVAEVLDYLERNELGRIQVESLRATLRPHRHPREGRLEDVSADRTRVRPGEVVNLRVRIRPFRGEVEDLSFEISVPEDVPEGRWTLLVGDGWSIERVRLGLEPGRPRSVQEIVDLLDLLPSRRDLAFLGLSGEAASLGMDGALFRLPPSIRALRQRPHDPALKAQKLSVVQEDAVALERPLQGLLRLDLSVERSGRWSVPRESDREGEGKPPEEEGAVR